MSNKARFCFQNSSPPLDTGNQNICGYLRYSESYLMLMIMFDFTTLFRAETVGDWASLAGGLPFPSMRQTGSLLKERIQRQGRGWSQTKRRLWKTRGVPSPTSCFVWACLRVSRWQPLPVGRDGTKRVVRLRNPSATFLSHRFPPSQSSSVPHRARRPLFSDYFTNYKRHTLVLQTRTLCPSWRSVLWPLPWDFKAAAGGLSAGIWSAGPVSVPL